MTTFSITRYWCQYLVILIHCLLLISPALGFSLMPGIPTPSSLRSSSRITCQTASRLFSQSDDDFMKSLNNRIDQANKLPLVFRDPLLPRQVLKITVKSDLFLDLVRTRLEEESPFFGMLGIEQNGDLMKTGVEVKVVEFAFNEEQTGVRLELKAGRRFEIVGDLEKVEQGWSQADVKFLSSAEEEAAQDDVMSKAVAMQQAMEFSDPNNSMNESKSLVDMWLDLARTNENFPGQIDQLLQDLGDMPPWEEPSECAFWVGALINPTQSLGLAFEMRPKLLAAKTAQERTQIVLDAIWNSIQRMDPSPRFKAWHDRP